MPAQGKRTAAPSLRKALRPRDILSGATRTRTVLRASRHLVCPAPNLSRLSHGPVRSSAKWFELHPKHCHGILPVQPARLPLARLGKAIEVRHHRMLLAKRGVRIDMGDDIDGSIRTPSCVRQFRSMCNELVLSFISSARRSRLSNSSLRCAFSSWWW